MNKEEVIKLLEERGAMILNSHLVYASGRHGSKYINKDVIFPHVTLVWKIGEALLVKPYYDRAINGDFSNEPSVILGPVVGGALLAQSAARSGFASSKGMLSVYADKEDVLKINYVCGEDGMGDGSIEKVDTKFIIKRGYDKLVEDKKVLIVEDILTTGGSVKKVVQAVKDVGGIPLGVSAICNRGGVTAEDIGVPWLCSLVDVDFESYPEKDCPLCKKGVPINTDVGKGREFLMKGK